jgi:hypothetical protein
MIPKTGSFYLIALLLIGGLLATTRLEAQSPADLANMKRLVGNWQGDTPQHDPTRQGHLFITMKGNSLQGYLVWDVDNVLSNRLKGDQILLYTFRLSGRRLVGQSTQTPKPLTGIVSQDFRQLQFHFVLTGTSMPDSVVSYHRE